MKNLLYKLSNTGITPATPFELRNKLTVYNNANLVVFFISLFYFGVAVVYSFYLSIACTTFSMFSCIFPFWLIKQGYHKAAFHYTMCYAFAFISAFDFLFGSQYTQYYLLFLPVACNILFNCRKTNYSYLLVTVIALLANVYYIENYEPYYHLSASQHFIGYPNLVFICLLIFLGVDLFKQENVRYANTIEEQRMALEEKNHEITDSINYAQKIQSALIPTEKDFVSYFKEAFVLFKPKDIVSGDFYWISKQGDYTYFAAADCTGHGVPGGFMTMLGISFLDEIVNEKNVAEPAEIISRLRERIIHTLKQTGIAGESKDGMDITLCRLHMAENKLVYAGANNSVYILSHGLLKEFKGDKQPCGFYHEIKPFTQREIALQAGDCIYTFSDGYADQFGGKKGKKFKYRQLEELLASSAGNFKGQKNLLEETILQWKGALEQVDDILLVGVKV